MQKIDIQQVIEERSPGYFDYYPIPITKLIIKILNKVLHIKEINKFLEKHWNKRGLDFIDEAFDYLDFGYLLSSKDRMRIPAEGRLICVANHPLGGLDGMALLKAIGSIRTDVKVVANDVLMNIENLQDLFLPYNIFTNATQRTRINGIKNALNSESAIIFFPAAEVSRLRLNGVKDKKWLNGPLYFARKYNAPILPVYIKGNNSFWFYMISWLNKKWSMFFLAHEIMKKQKKTITLKIGDPIPTHILKSGVINKKVQTKLLKRHVYRLAKNKKGIFKTEKNIIHPVDSRTLKNELRCSELLTVIPDGKMLYAVDWENAKNVVKEISRLREVTFRKVGEGTGDKYDYDEYDRHYKHIVLWDNEALEIVGAYRLGVCPDILKKVGLEGIYNASLFNFSEQFICQMDECIELGRSFIQQKYWKTKSLDYLWKGIGTFLFRHPEIKYLFGAVSISDYYSNDAKSLIVYFYKKWFGGPEGQVISKNQFTISKQKEEEISQILTSSNYETDLNDLKRTLKNYGYSIPVLFRQYSELCEPEGVKFLDFGVDENFSNTVDGLIFLNLNLLKKQKRDRYFPAEEPVFSKVVQPNFSESLLN